MRGRCGALDSSRRRRAARRSSTSTIVGRGSRTGKSGTDERILYVTPGYQLARSTQRPGAVIPSFGNARCHLKADFDRRSCPTSSHGEVGFQGAPRRCARCGGHRGVIQRGQRPRSYRNNKVTYGFDVRTGKRSGHFTRFLQKGEPGYDTWLNGSANTRATPACDAATVDEELGLVYLPVESPTVTNYGGHRPATISTGRVSSVSTCAPA